MKNTFFSWWQRRNLPLRVGLVAGSLALILALIGVGRGQVPLRPLSIFMALAISAGAWFLVSWAITAAAVDVEEDLQEAEGSESPS